jgi:hypothetical protein
MIAEELLLPEDIPSDFDCTGFESRLEKGVSSTKTNVYGADVEMRTPEKTMRFSSQSSKRKYNSLNSA